MEVDSRSDSVSSLCLDNFEKAVLGGNCENNREQREMANDIGHARGTLIIEQIYQREIFWIKLISHENKDK